MKKIVFMLCMIHSLHAGAQAARRHHDTGSLQEAEKAIKELEKENPAMAKKLRQMMQQKGTTVKPQPEDMTTAMAASVKDGYTLDYMAFLAAAFFTPAEAAPTQGEEIGMEMVAAFTTDHIDQVTGDPRLDKLQSDYNLSVKTRDLQTKMANAINQNTLLILFDANNPDEVLADAEANPRRSQDGMDIQTKVRVKLVHDPIPDIAAKTGKK